MDPLSLSAQDENDDLAAGAVQGNEGGEDGEKEGRARDRALVKQIQTDIKADTRHHEKAFKRMRRDQHVAMHGAEDTWSEHSYKANIIGRHVKMKTASLYAKNPRTKAQRRDTLDFATWDETPESLQLAQTTIMMQQQAALAASTAMPDPVTGAMPQTTVPGFDQAMEVMADFQQGMARRMQARRYARTMEVLDEYQLKEQKPLDFKRGMKQVVRRVCVNGVGFAELGFQREYGPRPGMTEKLTDARARLDHLKALAEEVGEGEIGSDDAEMAELELSVASLQNEPEIVLREGIVIDYPASTKVIPDRLTKYLEGFVGARHVTIEYDYTCEQVKELFGVDVSKSHTSYHMNAGSRRAVGENDILDDDFSYAPKETKKDGLVRVWKTYDKPSGLVYFTADGHPDFLRPPAAPDVFVEDFWPLYAVTFNDVESENELYPPSDVTLLLDPQMEYNRSRQGMREHRKAARPRWVYANGAFADETDPMHLQNLQPFEALALNMDPSTKIGDILQVVPIPGVDPNLYETNQLFTDMQLIGGAQEAQYGATTDTTATESAIAANATTSSDGSAIDDLDGFLTRMARARSQIYWREMSEEQVVKIVGPGAFWPPMSASDIAGEIYLDIEAGSSGKPNKAVEVNNWMRLAPILQATPGVNPLWFARETIKRLDDRVDLAEAIAEGMMSMIAQNAMTQPTMGAPGNDPNQQGAEGANNAPKPNPGPGSAAPMGDNRTTPGQERYGGGSIQ